MREKILQAIRKFQIETYLVTEKTVEGAELYFIKKELDMRRMKQDAVSAVTIYRDFETDGKKMRGSANINIFPEMTQEEVDEAVKGAYYAASFVKNPFFELPKGKKENKVQQCQRRGFAQASADIAQKKRQQTSISGNKRCCTSQSICQIGRRCCHFTKRKATIIERLYPSGHVACKCQQQKYTSGNGRVCKVTTQTAKQLLDHSNGNNTANSSLPERQCCRHI